MQETGEPKMLPFGAEQQALVSNLLTSLIELLLYIDCDLTVKLELNGRQVLMTVTGPLGARGDSPEAPKKDSVP